MRIVFHVGAHKTGSSLIQTYLRRSGRRRVASGTAVVPRHHAHELIGWGTTLLRNPDRLRHRIEAEARQRSEVLVISEECSLGRPFTTGTDGLYPLASEVGAALAAVSEGFDARVIMYLRPIDTFVESYYLQMAKQGATQTFDDWFAGVDPNLLSWRPAVEALRHSFGEDRVHVGDFREFENGQQAFLQRFLDRADIPQWNTLRYRHRSNPSVSQAGLEIALERNAELTTVAEQRASRRQLETAHSNVDGPPARPMPTGLRQLLRAATAGEYDQLTLGRPEGQ